MIMYYFLRYWPFILVYLTATAKNEIIADLKVNNFWTGNIYTSMLYAGSNAYFRTLLYYRNSNLYAKIVRVFYPKERTFIIDINTPIGGGLRLAHPFSTIVNAAAIGTNCYLNHLVTVGEKDGKRPMIGNNVAMHANCSIIGGITIGDNAVIGAGAVVVKDVPANHIAVGNPARIFSK